MMPGEPPAPWGSARRRILFRGIRSSAHPLKPAEIRHFCRSPWLGIRSPRAAPLGPSPERPSKFKPTV